MDRNAPIVASHADILLNRHAIWKDCVTSQKNVCVGGYTNRNTFLDFFFLRGPQEFLMVRRRTNHSYFEPQSLLILKGTARYFGWDILLMLIEHMSGKQKRKMVRFCCVVYHMYILLNYLSTLC